MVIIPAAVQTEFTTPLLRWYDLHGRKNLPWQQPRDPYRVWLSEIMLQQTQVKTVIPYFNRFITRFPTIQTLAMASEDDVLGLWSGLGYYSRGRNLHKTALIINTTYQGVFPKDVQTLMQLPGIGASTAAAIASQAFGQPTPILDGNVKRVLSRYFLIAGFSSQTIQTLWQRANECMSHDRPADYTQAIMDLGALCCTSKQPQCEVCPLQKACQAKNNNLIAYYPSKKPKKILPTQHQQCFLIHTSDNLIYLEKRPSKGIWGGLWCPPIIDINDDTMLFFRQTYALNLENVNVMPLMVIKHTFTHFRLHLTVLTLLTTCCNPSSDLQGGWFTYEEASRLGLAKPIRDIIARLSTKKQ